MQIDLLYTDNNYKLFPLEQASPKREWMDKYNNINNGYAYRCLPLTMANQSGWLMRCPVNFSATYVQDDVYQPSVEISFEDDNEARVYKKYIHSLFGNGVVTIALPYLIKTPSPWCVWARGYPNYYKENISFLEGIVETYWLNFSFTYNIRITEMNKKVSFSKGEPMMFMSLINLESLNNSNINIKSIETQPDVKKEHDDWLYRRLQFNNDKNRPTNSWQKNYTKGPLAQGIGHYTSIKLSCSD